jgi:hypothetical protein
MDRRTFLKTAGLAAIAATPLTGFFTINQTSNSVEVQRNGVVMNLLGTGNGKILKSIDGGKNWDIAADFGEHIKVLKIDMLQTGLTATLEHQGLKFSLRSSDGLRWIS